MCVCIAFFSFLQSSSILRNFYVLKSNEFYRYHCFLKYTESAEVT